MPRRKGREIRPAPNVRWNEKRGVYVLNVRDQRLAGGRASLSLGTDDPEQARTRRAAFFTMLESGRYGAIVSLRAGKVQWSDVERAVRTGDWEALRRASAKADTMADAKKRWLKEVRRKHRERPATIVKYEGIIESLVRSVGPQTTVDAVTSDHIRTWLATPRGRTGRPWSPNSQKVARATAKQFFGFEIRREREKAHRGEVAALSVNPVDSVETAKVEATRFEFLQAAEWVRIAEKIRDMPEFGPLAVGCLAGLRAGEVRHLRIGTDVDFERGVIRVQPRAGRHPWRPKTKNSIRDVPMSAVLRRILERHIALGFGGQVYLFIVAKRDQPMGKGKLQTMTEEAFTAAGIQYGQRQDALTFHSLRHTFASWLVQADVQLMKVAKLLGDTVEEVAKTYAHLLPTDLAEAVKIIDRTVAA